jgi:microcystin-dependent protein
MRGVWKVGVLALAAMGISSGRAAAQDCMIGEVKMFAGNFAPKSWALAQGQIMAISQNTALFSILGTTYGGNGQTTFALPDLRSRFPIGVGQGAGLSDYVEGQQGGVETVTQTVNEMAPHNHLLQVSSLPGTHIRPQGRVLAKVEPNTGPNIYIDTPDMTMKPEAITTTGGGQPQTNVPPYLGINFIICLEGIYPSRN